MLTVLASKRKTLRWARLAALLAGVLSVSQEVYAQFGPAKVVTAKVLRQPMPLTLTLVGTVEPKTRSLIGTEVAGLVVAMPARQGNMVSKGGILCELNQDTFAADLESAQAKLEALEARFRELQNGTRKEDLIRLKADLSAASARADRWAFEIDRIRKLQGVDFANQREYQDALAEHLAAIGIHQAAQADYDKGVAGTRPEVLAQAGYEVAEQRAEVKRANLVLEKTRIRAPFDGFVVIRQAEVGNWLPVGGSVVELVDTATVLVRVDAPGSAIPFAKIDAPVTIQIDALKKRFEGRIRHVIPQGDQAARTFPVEIEVDNPDHEIKSGMFARATIPAGGDRLVTVVPKDALIESGGSIFVALIVDGEKGSMAIPVPVTLGSDKDDLISITSDNIPPDAIIAIYGNERLTYPQPVIPVGTRSDLDHSEDHHANAKPEKAEHPSGS
ncbi:MAG: efflux RND transporter periplasmic adaptor subunit [Planctomycetes bacterium]|nr:efflux RND transporter periplasmic adaptor subunit [Planctomycetota bacterium]